MDETWTIGELAEQAAAVLATDRLDRTSGRVRDVPNERLIRWYTTIGLVDPPLSRRGRTAWYGHRHLLQLVAVKRRQAQGHALADIQAELTGATDTTLASIAELADPQPEGFGRAATESGSSVHASGGDRERFWTRRPAAPGTSPPAAAHIRTAPVLHPSQATQQSSAALPDPVLLHGVRLAPGVTLLLDPAARTPDSDDLTAIMGAAGPLLDLLARKGLIPSAGSQPSSRPPGSRSSSPEGSCT